MINSKKASAKDDAESEALRTSGESQQTNPPGVRKSKAGVWISGVLLALWTVWLVYLAFFVARN